MEKTPRFIAVDTGKFATKAVTLRGDGSERFITFRTKSEETQRSEAQGKSYIVEYKGKRYLVGEQAEVSSAKLTKAEDIHRISTYTAIHQLSSGDDTVVVAIGCPLSVFENPESKETYKKYMFPDRQIEIKVNETTKKLTILSVIVFPESSGIIYLDRKYESMSAGIIDIGGLNVNACVYNKTMPIISTLFTENLGSNVLAQNLKNALATKYGEDIPQWMMEDILRDGYVVDNMSSSGIREGSKEFIADFKKKHIESIIKKCEANGWNLRLTRLVFTGGTSELLRNEILQVIPGAIICEEPEKVNVRGFLKAITE
ncbi:MAG: ParM/StbA family protein [Lachnospiraceae bacterium]|nr:ParM/StbA family protein [Lachnospiraceae bacterium]